MLMNSFHQGNILSNLQPLRANAHWKIKYGSVILPPRSDGAEWQLPQTCSGAFPRKFVPRHFHFAQFSFPSSTQAAKLEIREAGSSSKYLTLFALGLMNRNPFHLFRSIFPVRDVFAQTRKYQTHIPMHKAPATDQGFRGSFLLIGAKRLTCTIQQSLQWECEGSEVGGGKGWSRVVTQSIIYLN